MENGLSRHKHNPHKTDSRIIKNKKIKLNLNHQVGLYLKIFYAEGIDDPSVHPFVVTRAYRVVLWVKPGEECFTEIVRDMLNPVWNAEGILLLGECPNNYEFLNLEVLRYNTMNEPATSNGTVVVGRARIPLPKEFNHGKSGRFGLVRPDHEGEGYKAEGHILLCMELKTW